MERPLSDSANPLLVVILGPTASGKTALSLTIAEQFSGEIINCDSVAMYREFEIGTAKPSAEERLRAPHHLFDCVDATGAMTAGEYSRRARDVSREISGRNHLPIVVGGTGLYLRAILDGLFAGPERSEELRGRLREQAIAKGPSYLHRVLRKLDRTAAEKIHANDAPKLVRAIEVSLAARKPMTEMWKEGREPLTGFRILRIGLNPDRALLYDRINARAQRMFNEGLVEETRQVYEKYSEKAAPLQSLGYKQAMQLLRGECDLLAAIQAAQQGHRNYAKRQMTWFRREPDVQWLAGFGDDVDIQQKALAIIRQSI
jgi:tRNA dimethylallyltransferase